MISTQLGSCSGRRFPHQGAARLRSIVMAARVGPRLGARTPTAGRPPRQGGFRPWATPAPESTTAALASSATMRTPPSISAAYSAGEPSSPKRNSRAPTIRRLPTRPIAGVLSRCEGIRLLSLRSVEKWCALEAAAWLWAATDSRVGGCLHLGQSWLPTATRRCLVVRVRREQEGAPVS